MEKQFNAVASDYDKNRKKFIPCFDAFYSGTAAFLAKVVAPKNVLDLGAGTGLLSAFWYERFPRIKVTLVDVAGDMLQLAQKRFDGKKNVSTIQCDYRKAFPDGTFDTVISALSIHHLEQEEKRTLFARIYKGLPPDGVFVNYDQFCAENADFAKQVDEDWKNGLYASGLDENDIRLWRERRALDRECSVEWELAALREVGFTAECIFLDRKFAVLVAFTRK